MTAQILKGLHIEHYQSPPTIGHSSNHGYTRLSFSHHIPRARHFNLVTIVAATSSHDARQDMVMVEETLEEQELYNTPQNSKVTI